MPCYLIVIVAVLVKEHGLPLFEIREAVDLRQLHETRG